jgi:hypothetical protein
LENALDVNIGASNGDIELFCTFVTCPVTSPYPLRMQESASKSSLIGVIKMTASSAYREVHMQAPFHEGGEYLHFLLPWQ